MNRVYLDYLREWLTSPLRKPLVMRGARQVGKTWLVRHLADVENKKLLELNFEKRPQYASLFASNDPKQILINLEAATNQKIDASNSLLFLDEIQAMPELLSKLRWFAEEMPELPVIVAGSLLEFTLAEHTFSMPVGRINYMHIEPLSFEEFLLALNKENLYQYLQNYQEHIKIPEEIHEQLTLLFMEFIVVGAMPAAVASWKKEQSLIAVNQIHHDLMSTYRDDFAKYSGKINTDDLDKVMLAVPKMLGGKFVYSNIDASLNVNTVKKALGLLNKARITHRVISSSANGVPLAAEVNEKYFKEIFLDVGLCCAALGLTLTQISAVREITLINKGGIAEQVVGQLLRTINPYYIEPNLYYWRRDEQGSNAEVDYVIPHGNKVIPIEVKAGSTGALKSLHLLMNLKKMDFAVRINSDLPSLTAVKVKNHTGNEVEYPLLSLPFYLLGQLGRLINLVKKL